ncbi:ABC transporter ATP-binding protein [Kutzneria buriramensis]|uniref:ATP-binding cassette subfamily B protein n=1 Tax=Kutzneria buriramensis TaxID=1045776 RepID=A0A3E0HFV3_9PSEU|nr:ABC transporter ATP-binding protein [Kutzneria buriramensis]REH44599.1 ATP-binding cassette subfamily B protein [Kutzneria buriramensis]
MTDNWIRRLLPFLKIQRRSLLLTFTAALAGAGLAAVTPLLERHIVDDVILTHRSALLPWLLALIAVGVLAFAASRIRRYRAAKVVLEVQYQIRNAVHEQLQRLDIGSHQAMPTGQLVSRIATDAGVMVRVLSYLPALSSNVLLIVVSLIVMVVLSPLLAVISALVVPALVVVVYRMRRQVRPATWDSQQRGAEVTQTVNQTVSGIRVVKAFGQEDHELDRFIEASQQLYGARIRSVRLIAKYQPLLQAIPAIGQVLLLALGGWLALHGNITVGTFLAFATYLSQVIGPAQMFAAMISATQRAGISARRIFDLLDSMPAVTDKPDATPLPPVKGDIAITDAKFGYLSSEPVLDGFTLRVEPGETVALVGTSGSGKSTVAMLLARFHDVQGGSVEIDGVDVRDVTVDSLRGQVGMVFEESFLFSDTVRANIGYGRPDATDKEIEAAARAAEAHEFILALPEGYRTQVGERGLTLSGGQRQRIALARALLTDPRILVLDDATSAVDARIEEGIHATLRRVMVDRTTLLIAHRRSTLRLASRIAVVDKGRVVAQGSHDELMAESPLYRRLLAGTDEDIDIEITDGVTEDAWQAEGGKRRQLAIMETPAEMAKGIAALPPVKDRADIDTADDEPHFSFRRFVWRHRAALGLGLFLVLLDAVATAAGPYFSREGIDNGVVNGSVAALMLSAGVFLAVVLGDLAVSVAMTQVNGRTGERLLMALKVRVFKRLLRLPVSFYDREMIGQVMTRMTTDTDSFSSLLQNGLLQAAASVLTFAGVLTAMAVMNIELTGVAALVLIPFVLATTLFRRLAKGSYVQARERISDVNAGLQESLSGVRESQAFGQQGRRQTEFKRLTRGYLDARMKAQRLISAYFPFLEFLSDLGAALVLGAGYFLIARGELTAGELIAFVLYLGLFFAPVQQLSGVFDDWQQAQVSMQRINDLLAEPDLTPTAARPIHPGRLAGRIALDDVWFRYPGVDTDVLRGMNLVVEPGETVALIGETGAGKSTVVKMLARFYDPDRGSISIDGTDLRKLEPQEFRRQLGYVPQEAFLFPGTIRDNIAYGRPDATDAEVEAAARAIGAHEFVAKLPGGYLHEIGERGGSLSAGQRQLLCLARAQLVDPVLLLLDEATANLDLATESVVSAAMSTLAAGRTTILIAHRLQTARGADRIAVMDAGQVVAVGTHEQLLADSDHYARLWAAFAVTPASRPA